MGLKEVVALIVFVLIIVLLTVIIGGIIWLWIPLIKEIKRRYGRKRGRK